MIFCRLSLILKIGVQSFCGLIFLAHSVCAQESKVILFTQPTSRIEILSDSIGQVPQDVSNIYSFPVDHRNEFKQAALVVGALVLFDKPITKFYQNHIETPFSGFHLPNSPINNATTGMGSITAGSDGWLLMGVGGTYLAGVIRNDEKSQLAGLQSVKALAYSVVVSQLLLKSITGRQRPISWASNKQPNDVYTDNPYQFGHVHLPKSDAVPYATAMPSFHFTAYFAVAKVYQRAYDNYWIPYSLAAIGLASNIRGHQHWVSDMTAGALIGTAIGMAVSDSHAPNEKSIQVLPYLDKHGTGLGVSARY